MVAGSTENPCMSRRPRAPSRSPPRRPWRPPEPPGPPPNPQRRGIRAGAAARRRRDAYIANSGGDPSAVPIVHAGGQRRPLGTSRYWEPSASEDSGEETDEVEFVAFTAAVDLTSLQAEHLVPRSRLWSPSGRNPSGTASSSSSGPSAKPKAVPSRATSSVVDTPAGNRPYDILKYYHPVPGVSLHPWSRVDIVYREASQVLRVGER